MPDSESKILEILSKLEVKPQSGAVDVKRMTAVVEMIHDLDDEELLRLLACVSKGAEQKVESARHTIETVIELRVAEASTTQTAALVEATNACREAVVKLGTAGQALSAEIAQSEGRERSRDRRAMSRAAVIGAVAGAVASAFFQGVAILIGALTSSS